MLHASPANSVSVEAATPVRSALIIDDEVHVRTYLRLTLASLGISQIWESGDGAEALELYAQHRPAIVLLDVNMPALPGTETLERLVTLDPGVAVIVVTSESGHRTVRRFLDLGAIGYVLKQRPPEELRAALQEVIARVANPEA